MTRAVITAVKAAAAIMIAGTLAVAPPNVLAAGGPTGPPPRAQLVGFVCHKALDPAARAVSVTAVMRPMTGTKQLQTSFALLEKAPGAAVWSTVPGPHFGVWVSPTNPPTLGQRLGDVWRVQIPVADLEAPASYRLQVSFRWLGRQGAALQTTRLLTKTCYQPELRPDLTVNSLRVHPAATTPGNDVYAGILGNIGATAAGRFTVQLTYSHNQNRVSENRTIQRLRSHATVSVLFNGAACDPGTVVTLTVDPGDLIDVYSRSAASLDISCPALS
jgi:hypothetical protein